MEAFRMKLQKVLAENEILTQKIKNLAQTEM